MIDLLPDGPDPANDIPAVFSQKAAAFVLAQKAMVPQINSAIGNLNSIAAGGAYAIPLTLAANPTPIGANLGLVAPNANAPSMQGATQIYIDAVDITGLTVKSQLDDVFGSTSASKGYLKLIKQGDPSKWISYRVDAWSYFATANPYGVLTVTCVGASSVNPFNVGDGLIMQCTRTGDKGDNGSSRIMLLRETLATGTSGPGLTPATWNQRALNTTNWNNISGASLGAGGAGTFRLPPGDYIILASAVALTTTSGTTLRQAIRLYNRTTSAPYDVSGTEIVNNYTSGGYATARPSLRTALTVSSTTDYSIDHYVSIAATGGLALNVTGYSESYTEVMVLKV